MNVLGIDVSHWQPGVDWGLLFGNGVRFAVVKASQGSYGRDPSLRSHAVGAGAAGMLVGLYVWFDPGCSPEATLRNFLAASEGLAFDFVAVDVEQYWKDWREWAQQKITRFYSGREISEGSRKLVQLLKQATGKRVVVYSRASFIREYAPEMESWLVGEDLWMAMYPYASGRVSVSWDVLKEKLLPRIQSPALPKGCGEWVMWQFSGDKFLLPGVSTAVDLNFFNGNLSGMRVWLGLPVEIGEVEISLENKVRVLWEGHPELWEEVS